jgi:hypothetical protein
MVSSSDKEYINTKMIKKGLTKMKSPFNELADWILNDYNVRPLNISYDILEHNKRPRLQVIFEFESDLKAFKADNGLFPNSIRQEKVKKAFEKIAPNYQGNPSDNLLVLFSAFEPIAKEEANGRIENHRVEKLKTDCGVWEIKRNFSTGIFFFFTNEQLAKSEQTGEREKLLDEYFKLIKEYDEFDYLDESTFTVKFDSKENFDKNYQGNWFYYSRDN